MRVMGGSESGCGGAMGRYGVRIGLYVCNVKHLEVVAACIFFVLIIHCCTHTHTHRNTHAHTHTYTHTHTHTYTLLYMYYIVSPL